jgi:predicted alpha/beta superfamily hydrolase
MAGKHGAVDIMQNIDIKDYEHNNLLAYGKLVTFDTTMESYPDKRTRTIRVLLPESYDGVKRFPILYMHDAQLLFPESGGRPKWNVDESLKKLSEEGLEIVVVGIDTSMHRGSELCPDCPPTKDHFMLNGEEPTGHLYSRFIVEHLKPIIDANFMVLDGPENTGVGGASMGGMISHYIALEYPEVFGKALVFSPAYSFIEWDVMKERMEAYDWDRIKNSKFYILSGGNDVERRLFTLRSSVRCYESLMEKDMDEKNVILVTDSRLMHHETSWGAMFADAVRYLFERT